MAIEETHSFGIDGPQQLVWDTMMDPALLTEWVAGFRSIEPVSGEPGQIGSVSRQIYNERGRTLVMTETITDRVEGKLFAVDTVAKGLHSTVRYEVHGDGPHHTVIRVAIMAITTSLTTRLLRPFLPGMMRGRLHADMHRLRRLVETRHHAGA